MHSNALYLTTNKAKKKKTTPRVIAITVMIMTNRSSSILSGDFWFPPDEARSAICPITVFAPIPITMPLPLPYLHKVPKNAIFFV